MRGDSCPSLAGDCHPLGWQQRVVLARDTCAVNPHRYTLEKVTVPTNFDSTPHGAYTLRNPGNGLTGQILLAMHAQALMAADDDR